MESKALYKFNYDYSKTMWLKMFLAKPDFPNRRSEVLINFEQALETVKRVDRLTQGITKIIYLVGWQGLGHDDTYPEMEKVNDFLKRDCDKDGRESLFWLVNEAKKYNTVISFHGNLADEYSDNDSHEAIVKANAVANGIDGKPAVIEIFNGRNAYKISYKQYYESGLFKKYWDRFMDAVPVREAGTVHLDNFCIAESLNPRTEVEEESDARNKMLDYIHECGIDVTTEYTYRESLLRGECSDHPIRKLYAQLGTDLPVTKWADQPMRTLGRIPASWWTSNMTPQDCIDIKPSLYSGHLCDGALLRVFYGEMHGEDIWMSKGIAPEKWVPDFLEQFCTMALVYFYLNRYDRLRIEEDTDDKSEGRYTAYFSDGIVTCGRDLSVKKNGTVLKSGKNVILPLSEDNRLFIAYSAEGRNGEWNMPDADFCKAEVYDITSEGNVLIGSRDISDGKISLDIKPGQAVAIKAI